MYRPNIAIIARQKNRFLIVHKPRQNDAWQFPQGGVDPGETEKEALIREFTEEIGTDKIKIITKSDSTYQYDFPEGYLRYDDTGQKFKGQRVQFYIVEFLGKENDIKLEEKELDDYKWVKKEELSQYFAKKEYLNICLKILETNHST
jgi:putative (di)nucleoside polyphosphate hydrolase